MVRVPSHIAWVLNGVVDGVKSSVHVFVFVNAGPGAGLVARARALPGFPRLVVEDSSPGGVRLL